MTRVLLLLLATVLTANWDSSYGQSLFNGNTIEIEGWGALALNSEDDYILNSYRWDEGQEMWSLSKWIEVFSEETESGEDLHIDEYNLFGTNRKYVYHNFRNLPEGQVCGEWQLPYECEYLTYPVADSIHFYGFDILGNPYERLLIISTGENGLIDTIFDFSVIDSERIQRGYEYYEYDDEDRLIYVLYEGLLLYSEIYFTFDSTGNVTKKVEVHSSEGELTWVDVNEYHFDQDGILEYWLDKYYSDSLVSLSSIDSFPVEFVGENLKFSPMYRYRDDSPIPLIEIMEWTIVDSDTSRFKFRHGGPPENLRWFDVTERRFDENGRQVASWTQFNWPGDPLANGTLTLRDDGSGRYIPENFVTRKVDDLMIDLTTEVTNKYSVENWWWNRWAGDSGEWQFGNRIVTVPGENNSDILTVSNYLEIPPHSEIKLVSSAVLYGYSLPQNLEECARLSSDDCPYTGYPNSDLDYFKYPFFDSIVVTSWDPLSSAEFVEAYFIETNADGLVSKIWKYSEDHQGDRSLDWERELAYDDQGRFVSLYYEWRPNRANETRWEYADDDGGLIAETHIEYGGSGMIEATRQEFFFDEDGRKDYTLIKEFDTSFDSPVSIDSIKYLYFSSDIELERRYRQNEEGMLVDYNFLRMKDRNGSTMEWGYQLNMYYNHIMNFLYQSLDDQNRHEIKWTMGFDAWAGRLRPADRDLYDYNITVWTDEAIDQGPPINFIFSGNDLVVLLDGASEGYVVLYTSSGQMVDIQRIEDEQVKVDTRNLITGIYYLNVTEDNRSRSAAVFVKGQN